MVRSGVKPVAALVDVAKEVAGGNLKVEVRHEGFGGEMRELANALKEMIASLLENISKAYAANGVKGAVPGMNIYMQEDK